MSDLPNTFQVRVGYIRPNSIYAEQNVMYKKTYVFPHYEFPKQYDDITLVQLERRIPFNYTKVGCIREDIKIKMQE